MNQLDPILSAWREHTLKLAALFGAFRERCARQIEGLRRGAASARSGERAAIAVSAQTSGVRSSSTHSDDGLTIVQPSQSVRDDVDGFRDQARTDAERQPVHDDATVVKPASRSTASATSDSSADREDWQRVAHAQGGDDARVGMLLKGRFLLERELGRGGMGVVYLARDERKVEARDRDPYVAVKVLNDEFRRHPDSLIALQREARRAQRLADDNIVHVYDFDKDGTIVFMTMEYIDGTDLRTLIRERASTGMPFATAWPLIDGMARALQRAHASGIVHSDFKPGNVMITRDGVPKVFDFGIARAGKSGSGAGAGAAGEQTIFDAGTLGALTPAYASLEMIDGAHPVARDDVYALGCVIFELLTGRHPFDRHSADAALEDGLVPPPVPGLSRRQQRALCDAVAFHGDRRLQSVGALIDGLRRRNTRERLVPYVAGAVVVALLAAGGSIVHHHVRHRQIDTVVARFSDADPHHYENEDQAMSALDALGEDERERLVLDQSDTIQRFLEDRVDAYWSPALGRMDYAAVQHVFQLRDRLRLFSPRFDTRRKQIDDERADMLGKLAGNLDDAIDRDALFEDQPGSSADILKRIRALDPDSALLKSGKLEARYDAAIGQSIDLGKFDEARSRIALAMQLFPASGRLLRRQDQLQAAIAFAAAHPDARANPMSLADARSALAQLAAHPASNAQWLDAVANAMSALQHDDSPDTEKAIDTLADGIVNDAAQASDPAQAQQHLDQIEVGLRYDPHSPGLAQQRDRMQALLQAQKIDQQIASGDAASLTDAVRAASAARDGVRALHALNRLRALQPADAFVGGEGAQLVAVAFLGNAQMLCREGKLADAASVVSQGANALPGDTRLSNAAQRYQVASDILDARGKPVADPDYQDLRARYAATVSADPAGMQQLERDLGNTTTLPQGGLGALLDQIKEQNADAAGGIGGDTAGAGAGGQD